MSRQMTEETTVSHRSGVVTYKMLPHVARSLAAVLAEEGRKRNDSGWKEDADKLLLAGTKAER